jgi:D-galactarolactone cycloisomerase
MRIEHIEVINLCFEYPEEKGFRYAGGTATGRLTSIVRVMTNRGHVGVGAAYSHPDIVRLVIEHHLRPLLLGADPREVEDLWTFMYRQTRWYGRKGAALSALGALDTAFWDLRGKDRGMSVARMLGAERTQVPAYASGLLWSDDVQTLADEAIGHVDNGYRRVKMRLGRDEAYDVAAVKAVRRAVGSEIDVMVDGSMRYSVEVAERIGNVLAAENVFWFEEPFEPDELDQFVALRDRVTIPLAAGENEFGYSGFRELLRVGAVDIVQPDACRAGGITECVRVGQLAVEYGAAVATHTWSDAVALTANAHVIASLPNGITVEVDRTSNPFIDELLIEPITVVDGLLTIPSGPGLGIELNEQILERFRTQDSVPVADGNYSDLVFGQPHLRAAPPYAEATTSAREMRS